MDPRRGQNLSPMFAAFLCWLPGLEPNTDPAITDIAVSGNSVLAATSDDPLFDAYLGSLPDFERNLRGWGEACGPRARFRTGSDLQPEERAGPAGPVGLF